MEITTLNPRADLPHLEKHTTVKVLYGPKNTRYVDIEDLERAHGTGRIRVKASKRPDQLKRSK